LAGSSYGDVQKQKYAANFVAKYGEIDANQSWDFATGERQLATRGVSTISTRIMEKGIDWGDVSKIKTKAGNASWYETFIQIPGGVEKNGNLLDAMVKALPEKQKQTGQPAVLVAPASGFYIYPLLVVAV
jgi:hypothetical protein